MQIGATTADVRFQSRRHIVVTVTWDDGRRRAYQFKDMRRAWKYYHRFGRARTKDERHALTIRFLALWLAKYRQTEV